MDKKVDEILDYWYGDFVNEGSAVDERHEFWFGKSEQSDEEITERFLDDVNKQINNQYQHWLKTPRARLASIILIDQFCRQIYRDTPAAFENDHLALGYCLDGIELAHDMALPRPLRYFFYLPLEHSENLDHQHQCVAAYQAMADEAPEKFRYMYIDAKGYAVNHLKIIQRFGRFPHRNQILGRISTAQEIEFLKQEGSSF